MQLSIVLIFLQEKKFPQTEKREIIVCSGEGSSWRNNQIIIIIFSSFQFALVNSEDALYCGNRFLANPNVVVAAVVDVESVK